MKFAITRRHLATLMACSALSAGLLSTASAQAQEVVKFGYSGPLSGSAAHGSQSDRTVRLSPQQPKRARQLGGISAAC